MMIVLQVQNYGSTLLNPSYVVTMVFTGITLITAFINLRSLATSNREKIQEHREDQLKTVAKLDAHIENATMHFNEVAQAEFRRHIDYQFEVIRNEVRELKDEMHSK